MNNIDKVTELQRIISTAQDDLAKLMKPTKKVIDMSALINGIDCEFSDDDGVDSRFGKLIGIKEDGTFRSNEWVWDRCTPRMDHKHAWDGGYCPLPEGFIVELTLRDDTKVTHSTETKLTWSHDRGYSDIIYFEVLRVADGYVMPWESE